MVQELRFGLMEPNMKENGVIIRPTVKVNSGMQTETCTTENGRTTKPTDSESTSMSTEPNMKATGRMIFKMAGVSKAGLMEASMMVCTKRA